MIFSSPLPSPSSSRSIFWAILALVSATLLADSLMFAYVGDESFHLLAAKLVSAGRVPYRDFFYQHPPLFIYIIGGIFRAAGTSWRVAHAFSALALIGGVLLAALYARDLFRDERLRWQCATLVVILIGLNCYTLVFAVNGYPQGFSIFCLMGALYLSRSLMGWRPFLAGVLGGFAAESTLLAVPALVVFVVWLTHKEKRRGLLFLGGAVCAFLPLVILLAIAPSQTFADVMRYHFVDRPRLGWRYDAREVLAWFGSLQGVLLCAFAVAGVSLRKDDDVRLCGWISLSLVVSISLARTTSAAYFLVATPFIAILAATGVVELARQTDKYARQLVLSVTALYCIGLIGIRFVLRWETFYDSYQVVDNVVKRIGDCAPRGEVYTGEAMYFAGPGLPSRGFENRFDPAWIGRQAMIDPRVDVIVIDSPNPLIPEFNLYQRFMRVDAVPAGSDSLLVFCHRI